MYVSQVVMAPLANIEIVSLLIILTTRKFGLKALLSVYAFVFCEVLTYGISMWVINYLYVWAVLMLIVYPIRKFENKIIYVLVSAIFGLFFGVLCSVPYFVTGGVAGGIAYIVGGLYFDLLHCVGNFVLTFLLFAPMTKALDKVLK